MDYAKTGSRPENWFRIPLILTGLVFAAALAFTPRPGIHRKQRRAGASNGGHGRLRLSLTHTNIVDSVAWSPDGSKIAAGDRDGNLRVWGRPQTGASLLTMSGHDGDVDELGVVVRWQQKSPL
jgi:WD40 repeat protein